MCCASLLSLLWFQVVGDEALDKNPLCTRLPQSAAEIVRGMDNKTAFIREAVLQKLITEGLWDPS